MKYGDYSFQQIDHEVTLIRPNKYLSCYTTLVFIIYGGTTLLLVLKRIGIRIIKYNKNLIMAYSLLDVALKFIFFLKKYIWKSNKLESKPNQKFCLKYGSRWFKNQTKLKIWRFGFEPPQFSSRLKLKTLLLLTIRRILNMIFAWYSY